MRSSTHRFFALVVAAAVAAPATVALTPSSAYAQGKRKPLRDQLPDAAAKKQYDEAAELYKYRKFDAARAAFYALYESTKNPRILFNVAVCEKDMGRFARAIELYQRELAEGKDVLAPDEVADVKAQISALERFVAQLTIEVNEPGAEVFVDDTKVSPITGPISVQIGERRVRATKPGFAEATQTIDMKPGASEKVSLKLLPINRTSLVTISVTGPQSADVLVDGRVVGQASPGKPYQGQVAVSPEPHKFSVQAPGFVSTSQPAVVREGEKLKLDMQLSREQEMGKLVVETRPADATIEIDGKTVGSSHWDGPVSASTHQVVVKKQGYYTTSYDVEVPKGGERRITATLNEDRNTSFVPWLIGTIVIVGAGATVSYFVFKPKDQEPVNGSLPPYALGTPALRFGR
jgi:hypothetical protein